MHSANGENGEDGDRQEPGRGADRFWRRYGAGEGSGGDGAPDPGPQSPGDLWDEPSGDPWDEPQAATGGDSNREPPHDPWAGAEDPRYADYRSHRHAGGDGHECLEWCPICRGAEILRTAVPPELREQFEIVQRDMLLMAQAMIESHLARMRTQGGADGPGRQGEPPTDPPVEDIPIQ